MSALFKMKYTNMETGESFENLLNINQMAIDNPTEKNLYMVAIEIAFRNLEDCESLDAIECIGY